MFPFSTCALHPTESVSPRITLASVDAEKMDSLIGSFFSLTEGFCLLFTSLRGFYSRSAFISLSCVWPQDLHVDSSFSAILCFSHQLYWNISSVLLDYSSAFLQGCHLCNSELKLGLGSVVAKPGTPACALCQFQQIPIFSHLFLKPFNLVFSKASTLIVKFFLFIWNFSCTPNP